MSDTKHSPLPWRATDHIEPRYSVVAADGTVVVPPRYKDGGGRCQADLDLIAAAPDLLAACEKAVKACRENLAMAAYKNEPLLLAALQGCEAAIRKATN